MVSLDVVIPESLKGQDVTVEPLVRMVMKDINAILPAHPETSKNYEFENVPVGERVTIVAYAIVNDQPVLCTKDLVIGKSNSQSLKMQPTTWAELEKAFTDMNG